METKSNTTNIEVIQKVVDEIEEHLEDNLSLDELTLLTGYSKYHLSRMFVSISGFTLHNYIQRRRLTEAARMLVFTDKSIIEIALLSGYETQQSFTMGFRAIFHCSPNSFRRKQKFYPFQLKTTIDGHLGLKGDKIMDIRTEESSKLQLIGYKANTKLGFWVIGRCWRKLHAKKGEISERVDPDFLVGVNDYTKWNLTSEKQPVFDYYAMAQVSKKDKVNEMTLPKGMVYKEYPAGKYVVFSFYAESQDSLQPVTDFIYKEWFPQSNCCLNEEARYDFAKYGEKVDKEGKSLIEYWVPILS